MGKHADGVIKAILDSLRNAPTNGFRNVKSKLKTAQRNLVRDVCHKCWCGGLKDILWVNTYAAIAEDLLDELRVTMHPKTKLDDLYIANPAGVGMDQMQVQALHATLFTALELKPQDKWLTTILTVPDAPPRVTFWKEGAEVLRSDWAPLPMEDLAFYIPILFAERDRGRYLHLSYPLRKSLPQIGPAGVYLFLASQYACEQVPRCLIASLQAFLQALVTAQSIAVREHLREHEKAVAKDLRSKILPIIAGRAYINNLHDAAKELLEIVDPLHVNVDSLAKAARIASALFPISRFHEVRNHLENGNIRAESRILLRQTLRILKILASEGVNSDDPSMRVVSQMVELSKTKDGNDDSVGALIAAKALSHSAVTCELIGCKDPHCRGREREITSHAGSEDPVLATALSGILPPEFDTSVSVNDVGEHVLTFKFEADPSNLKIDVDGWLKGLRVESLDRKSTSRKLATLLRAVSGPNNDVDDVSKWEQRSLSVRLGTKPLFVEEE